MSILMSNIYIYMHDYSVIHPQINMGKLSKNHLHFVLFITRDPLGFTAALAQKVHLHFCCIQIKSRHVKIRIADD